jgi:hypothetical protein
VEEDLLRVTEEVKNIGGMLGSFNYTFIVLISKKENLESFDEFKTIFLCNCIYKIIAKVIAVRIKRVLLAAISLEQFSFLEGRKIHAAIGPIQEDLRYIKSNT